MPDETRQEKNERLAHQYGYALAFFKSDPELWNIFQKAVNPKNNWTGEKFDSEVKKSAWFKKHAESARLALKLKTEDSATWDEMQRKQREAILNMAGEMGVELPAGVASKMSNDVAMLGLSEAEVKNRLAGYIDTVKGTKHFGGEAGDSEDGLRKLAGDMGQKLSDTTLKSWVRSIAKGDSTLNDFDAKMRSQAEAMYPGYTDQIRRGLTLRDVADPYIETMASALELNPANIGIFDSRVQKALKHRNADSGKAEEYSMYDFETEVRRDPRWTRTKQAQDAGMNVANQIMRDMGFIS